MNHKLYKISAWIFLAITIGAFVVCLNMICDECGQPDLPSSKGSSTPFQTRVRGMIATTSATGSVGPMNLSATYTATPQDTPEDFFS